MGARLCSRLCRLHANWAVIVESHHEIMVLSHIQSRLDLSRDGNLDLDTGLEGNAGLLTR